MGGIKRTPADVRFSNEIRERDNWTCQRCGKRFIPPTRALHAAHYFTRRTGATRVNPDNALALCYGCHQFVDSHKYEKDELWMGKLGVERFEALAALGHGKRDRVA
jgi:5-methylcytosine-specific restriction endonuclease McrA